MPKSSMRVGGNGLIQVEVADAAGFVGRLFGFFTASWNFLS